MDSDTRRLDGQEAARVVGSPAIPAPAPGPVPTSPMPGPAPIPSAAPYAPVGSYDLAPTPPYAPAAGPPPATNGAPQPTYAAPAPAPPAAARGLLAGNNLIALALIALGLWFFVGPRFSFGELFGSSVVLVIGLVFLYAYVNQGRNFGFLVPGAILTGIGTGIVVDALSAPGSNGWVPLGLGLGFCAIWFLHRQHWWALIPGGITAITGLAAIADSAGWMGWGWNWSNGWSGGNFWTLMLILVGAWLIFGRSGRRRRR